MDVAEVIVELNGALDGLSHDELVALDAESSLALVRDLEVVARRLASVQVDLAGAIESSGAHSIDGHRTAKAALMHLGRLSGPEAHRRVRTARALRSLPEVGEAFAAGRIPVEMAQAVGRCASNPRVRSFLNDADPIFAEQAAEEPHDPFVSWLGEWERLADADGAEQPAETAHRHRSVTLVQNGGDGSWLLKGQFGPAQGAALAEVLEGFESAERLADHDEAVARVGEQATPADHERSASQRRADAFVAMAALAATAGHGRRAEPLVDIVIDRRSFEDGLARLVGSRRRPGGDAVTGDDDGPVDLDGRHCGTTTGHRVTPSDAVAAALVGHVRRVVIDDEGRIIDLGRRRRLFTGGARDAAVLQAVLDERGGVLCLWSGCHSPPAALQVDHADDWSAGGCTDVANSALLCGHHNRLKSARFRPVRDPDGRWTFLRPDGTTITPPI